jgi:hypothetical protein
LLSPGTKGREQPEQRIKEEEEGKLRRSVCAKEGAKESKMLWNTHFSLKMLCSSPEEF